MRCGEFEEPVRRVLLNVARRSIERGVSCGARLDVSEVMEMVRISPRLEEHRATFVTLSAHGALRGCTGSLEPVRPVVRDVAENAYFTAFHDPRFSPLRVTELTELRIEISVLTPLEPMAVSSERELLAQLEPGMGLVIEDAGRRGTFLPKVWEMLPDPHQFLVELKLKAGLPADHWSPRMNVFRYYTQTFGEATA